MNENMVNVLKKINEMQMKLNIINENIEEIKNDRKNLEEKSKKSKSIYSRHNSIKDQHQNSINIEKDIDNNPNLNFIYKKNLNNSSKHINFNFNSNKTSSCSNNKEKGSKYNNSQIYDEYELKETHDNNKLNDNISQANIIENTFGNKKNRYMKKNRTSLSSFDNNCDKNSFFEQNEYNYNHKHNHNHNHFNQTNDYFYKKSMSKNNYYYMKKGLNCSDFNKIRDNNSEMNLNTTKNKVKTKKIISQKNSFCSNNRINENIIKGIKYNNCNRNVFNNIINSKKRMIFRTNRNCLINDNDNLGKKTIDLDQNYSHDKDKYEGNCIYENSKNDYMTVKNRTRNNNINDLNYMNNNISNNNNENIIYFKKTKDAEHISDDLNNKHKKCFSIDEQRIQYNENKKKFEPKLAQTISHTIYSTKKKNPKINHHNNNNNNCNNNNHINNSHTKKGKEVNYEQILFDIIDITNKFNNHEGKINVDNVIDEYKMMLRNIKIKNVFIYNLINMYNNSTKSNLNCREPKSLVSIWNWIISNQNKNNKNEYLKNEDMQYKRLCQEIMKQYNIENIQQLKMFIDNSFKKINNNDNFLEGIKKILME